MAPQRWSIGWGVAGLSVVFAAGLSGPAAAQSRCDNPQQSCGAAISADCLVENRVGAGAMAAAGGRTDEQEAICAVQRERYRNCLQQIARDCSGDQAVAPAGAQPGGGCTPDLEQRLWDTVKNSNDPEELTIFIESCPDSPFARVAERRIAAAETRSAPSAAPSTASGAASSVGASGTLSPAASAPDYRTGQRELRRLGLYTGGIDGDWGRGSQAAMRAFQRREGLPEDGRLTPANLAALQSAPTPAAAAAPAEPSFSGRFAGTWRDTSLGVGGRSEFQVVSYDVATGAIQGRMATEYQGLVSSGMISGTLTAGGGRASGQLYASNGAGWSTVLTYNPTSSVEQISGTFRSSPLPGTFGVPISGAFQVRQVR